MKNNNEDDESLNEEATISEKGINEIINKIDQDDWILANIARLVYNAGFRKNEIENIKIGNVRQGEEVVSEIKPFLSETTRACSTMPIILNDESKEIIDDHIKKLTDSGYNIDDDSPLFPDKKTKKPYVPKTLTRQLKKNFKKASFNNLRANGIQRQQTQLEEMNISRSQRDKELKKFSRHSRPSTTKKLIAGDVQKAGKSKKEDRSWESIVKSIEGLTSEVKKKETLKQKTKEIQDNISAEKDKDVRESLGQLLNAYIS
jgi:integrase